MLYAEARSLLAPDPGAECIQSGSLQQVDLLWLLVFSVVASSQLGLVLPLVHIYSESKQNLLQWARGGGPATHGGRQGGEEGDSKGDPEYLTASYKNFQTFPLLYPSFSDIPGF